MKVKTADLSGPALDWAVAKYKGLIAWKGDLSSDQAFAGPILDEEHVATRRTSNGTWYAIRSEYLGDSEAPRWYRHRWAGHGTFVQARFKGPTRLVAGLRCVVAHHLGEEIDVPDSLLPDVLAKKGE